MIRLLLQRLDAWLLGLLTGDTWQTDEYAVLLDDGAQWTAQDSADARALFETWRGEDA